MSLPYEITPQAMDDLLEIWDYTAATWGDDQADRYYQNLQDDFEALAIGHKQGRPCGKLVPEANREINFYLSGKHYVFFRFGGSKLIVLTVIHGSSQEQIEDFLKSH